MDYDTGYGANLNWSINRHSLQNSQILCKNHEKLEIILVSIFVDVFGLTFCTVIVYYVTYDISYETGLLIAFAIWVFFLGGGGGLVKFCSRITRNWKMFVMNISRDALVKYFPQWLFIILIYTL